VDLGSDQGYSIAQIDQLLMKGSAEISSEFHPELIPDPLGYWFDPDVTDGSGIRCC